MPKTITKIRFKEKRAVAAKTRILIYDKGEEVLLFGQGDSFSLNRKPEDYISAEEALKLVQGGFAEFVE